MTRKGEVWVQGSSYEQANDGQRLNAMPGRWSDGICRLEQSQIYREFVIRLVTLQVLTEVGSCFHL
jgi:hypothetical protein